MISTRKDAGHTPRRNKRIIGRIPNLPIRFKRRASPARMNSRPDKDQIEISQPPWGRRLHAAVAAVLGVGAFGALIGFIGFILQLRGAEIQPARHADGIVVLTGGSSRVSDAIELLAGGYGKRLLISGVHPASGPGDISRSLPDSQTWLGCCVDLDHSDVNTRSNAAQTRRWTHDRGFKSLIVVTSNYHMPRAIVELSHAMPDIDLIPFAVVGDKWRDEPWWTSSGTLRLVLSEYVKYLAAEMRVLLADVGVDVTP